MSPDQLWSNRPDRELSNYRTPVKGLYLCGADTHPGGGVSGVPGYLCSTEALIDAGIVRKKFKYHEILRLVKGILSLRSS